MTAAIWSAIAATCAAFCAFCMLLIQRRNLQESVRPEIVLLGWKRSTNGVGAAPTETLTIAEIKDVGRGLAIHGMVFSGGNRINQVYVTATRFFALEPGETRVIDLSLFIWWNKITTRIAPNNPKSISFPITVVSWDTQGRQHTTTYHLMVNEPNPSLRLAGDGPDGLGPGVYLTTRETKSTAVWLLKLQKRIRRIGTWVASSWVGVRVSSGWNAIFRKKATSTPEPSDSTEDGGVAEDEGVAEVEEKAAK